MLSSKSGNISRSGVTLLQVAQLQPLAGEVARPARRRAGRRSCAAPAPRARRAARSRPAIARFSSSSSGMLLQRKNDSRDASSTSLIAMRRAGRQARRVALGAEQERRAGQDAREAGADAGVEVAALGARVAVERQRRLDVVVVDRPAEGAPRERREDLVRRTAAPRPPTAGVQTNSRSRLGVSLTPVTLYGPSMIAVCAAAAARPGCAPPGCRAATAARRPARCAGRSTKVKPTSCGPAVTVMRGDVMRSSIIVARRVDVLGAVLVIRRCRRSAPRTPARRRS